MSPFASSARALVVLPTYNEVDTIGPLIDALVQYDRVTDIVVVDDSSPDGTGTVVERMQREEPRIHLLMRPRKLGLGSAHLAGFAWGMEKGHDLLVTMDADLSHDPSDLPALLEASVDYPLVIGSRYVEGGSIRNWPWHRRLLSAAANHYARIVLGLDVRDCTSAYRCYQRGAIEAANAFEICSSGYSFVYEMLARATAAGLEVGERPIVFEGRRAGKSKINSSEIFVAIWRVLVAGLRSRHGRSS